MPLFKKCLALTQLSVALISVALPATALAHSFEYGTATTELRAQGSVIELTTQVSQVINADAPDLDGQLSLYTSYFGGNFSIQHDGRPCPLSITSFDLNASTSKSMFYGSFECDENVLLLEKLTIHSTLFLDVFKDFSHFITFSVGSQQHSLVFTPTALDYPAAKPSITEPPAERPASSLPSENVAGASSPVPTSTTASSTPNEEDGAVKTQGVLEAATERFSAIARQFIWLGMKHIWTGYDHILFLLSIILLLRSWKKILLVVTSFTVAHSITLILAGLHILVIPSRVVEPIIALSIAYMAVRNIMILRKSAEYTEVAERWMTTFAFGLAHGLGFAGALLEKEIPKAFFVPSLVIFNIGIEIGQLAIIAVVVPLLLRSDRLSHRKKILAAVSAAITILALFWFFGRVF
jgi:hydrogenase/urease accessory protein HupE